MAEIGSSTASTRSSPYSGAGNSDNSTADGSSPESSTSSVDTWSSAGSSTGVNANEPTTTDRILSGPGTTDALSADSALDILANAGSTAGAVNVGFNVPMQGLNLGPVQVDAMQFGRFAPGTTSPTTGYSINVFGRPQVDATGKFDFGGHMARQTIVSSQAAFEHAQSVDSRLSNTRFEVASPDTAVNRSYDIEFTKPSGAVELVEVKAGKSIDLTQVPKDIDLANSTGQRINYVHTGNPITGNHGPDQRTAAKLADMTTQTNGLISHQTVDIAPTSRQVDAVVGASQFSRAAHGASKVLGPAAVALDVYTIKTAFDKDGGNFGENTQTAVAETAGGWAGAAAGGWAGAQVGGTVGTFIGGPVGTAVGAAAGGIIGAIGGAIGGSSLGNTISGWF